MDDQISPNNDPHGWIWFITGPTASGKTTVAKALSGSFDFTYIEGDDFRPKGSIDKMNRGIPLTDADYHDWLLPLREECSHQYEQGHKHLAVSCSTLTRQHRDTLRQVSNGLKDAHVGFVCLDAPEEVLLERAIHRHGRYAGGNLVQSQFHSLEPPSDDETDVLRADAMRGEDRLKSDVMQKVEDEMRHSGRGYIA
ncbi:shikimate kinase [Mariannaea sp. PMI_226]|nr:shikimate kinase [Mariannaea sp. PMI_226]